MKQYPKNKFENLGKDRQAQILLDLIYDLESHWDNESLKGGRLSLLQNYFQWACFYEEENSILSRLAGFEFKIDANMSLRSLLDLAVPLERFLNLSIKDEHLLQVRQGDQEESARGTSPLYFILDHLRSAFNVGSLFRTAECFGVSYIYLVGYTPTPEDKGVQKTAMGTETMVSWSQHHHLEEVLEILAKKEISVFALETVEGSEPLQSFKAPESMAWLVGNERYGLNPAQLKNVSGCVEIPMLGQKNSLNVANSLSVATFEVIRQWKKSSIIP